MSTSVIHRIAIHDTAGTDPTALLPALNATMSAAALQAAGWVTLGSADQGDDGNLDSDAITVTPIQEGTEIRPPGSLTRNDTIVRHNGIDEVSFTAYDIAQAIVELDSTASSDDNEVTRGRDVTYRAMLVEITGIRVDYYPRVMLRVTNEPGGFGPGDDAVAKTEFLAKVHSYATTQGAYATAVPGGRVQIYLEEAGT